MARPLPAHLLHKCALALLPQWPITAPIEAVRRVHDKHFARWPPHINLLYPFLASPSDVGEQEGPGTAPRLKDSIRQRIQRAVGPIKAFHVSLNADPAGMFSHSAKSKTVWLGPSGHSIGHVQAALQAEFAECHVDPRPFTPHLSVGQAHNAQEAENLMKEIRQSVASFLTDIEGNPAIALDWPIDKVFVIERKGYHDRFKIIGSIELSHD